MLNDPTFWFLVAFVCFIGLVGKKAWNFLLDSLDRRNTSIKEEIAEALRLQKEAQNLLNEMREKKREAESQAHEILKHAHLEAERLQSEAKKEIEEFIKRHEMFASEKITQAKRLALKDIHKQAVEAGIKAAEKVFSESFDSADGSKLIDQSLEDLKQDFIWDKKSI